MCILSIVFKYFLIKIVYFTDKNGFCMQKSKKLIIDFCAVFLEKLQVRAPVV